MPNLHRCEVLDQLVGHLDIDRELVVCAFGTPSAEAVSLITTNFFREQCQVVRLP